MHTKRALLLTGATGFLGRYLLRELLLAGASVAVVVRDSLRERAEDRVAALTAFWQDALGVTLPAPVVLTGDLRCDNVGLGVTDRRWVARNVRAVVHAAANLSFHATTDGEPWRTNVDGTANLLRLGVSQWHLVSTAFVCGRRQGVIAEDDTSLSGPFNNVYEHSKAEAERIVRSAPGIRTSVYRPAVIVGDSRTGYTSSYLGLYRFLELAARLAGSPSSPRRLPLRLPLDGDEPVNLVCVDWVSRAIASLIASPAWLGRTFHLVPREPVRARLIHDVAAAVLGIEGTQLGHPSAATPNGIEAAFLDGVRQYWSYLGAAAMFRDDNIRAAVPHLPPPRIDRAVLLRQIRFAVANNWGRGRTICPGTAASADRRCRQYFEQSFPEQARQSGLARAVGLDILVGFDIKGPGGGQWSCEWRRGEFLGVCPGVAPAATVVYRTDRTVFDAILDARFTPQQAFFDQRIKITGDIETALKLAVLFEQFLAENAVPGRREVADANLA
jgi:thioester reductase-like protein